MSLSVQVGLLAYFCESDYIEDAEYFANCVDNINLSIDELEFDEDEEVINPHVEPTTLPLSEMINRTRCESFPYSYLHYLRRFYVFIKTTGKTPPQVASDGDPYIDVDTMALDEVSFESHLLAHSDSEGFYLPADFEYPLFDSPERIVGQFLGSSQVLQRELIEMAPFLDINLDDKVLSDAESDKLNQQIESETSFYREKLVWLTLFEAARLSIQYQSMIYFV